MKAKPQKKFKRKSKKYDSSKRRANITTEDTPFETKKPAGRQNAIKSESKKPKSALDLALSPPKKAKNITKADALKHRLDLYQLEWSIKYQHLSPHQYLRDIKGFSESQYIELMKIAPTKSWDGRRNDLKSQISNTLIRRHIDQLAEMNDKHATVGKIGIAEGLKLLTKGVLVKKPGKKSKSGKVQLTEYTRPLYPREFKEIMDGMKTAQSIYRTAMGLPNDHQGLTQVLEKLASESRQIQNNLQINIGGVPVAEKTEPVELTAKQQLENKLNELSYDEVMVFITHKRKRIAEAEGEEIKEVASS